MAKTVHGPDFDPTTEDIDGEIVMRIGGGKKHGRYWIGDDTVDTASTPTLSQILARSTGSAPPISQRPTVSQLQLSQMQVISFILFVHCLFILYLSIITLLCTIVGTA